MHKKSQETWCQTSVCDQFASVCMHMLKASTKLLGMENLVQTLIRAEHISVFILWLRIVQKKNCLQFRWRYLKNQKGRVTLTHTANREGYTEKQLELLHI